MQRLCIFAWILVTLRPLGDYLPLLQSASETGMVHTSNTQTIVFLMRIFLSFIADLSLVTLRA